MAQVAPRNLRAQELLILAIGILTLHVDRDLLTGLLPQVSLRRSSGFTRIVRQLATLLRLVYAVSSPVVAALTDA